MSQWEKGQSGNPAGRPPGSKNAQTELRAELQAHGKEILGQLVEKAKTGELVTARFLLRHILPAARVCADPSADAARRQPGATGRAGQAKACRRPDHP